MNDQRFARAQDLFGHALALPEAARPTFLRAQCSDDAALADEVMALLGTAAGAGVLDTPVMAPPQPSLLPIGTRIDQFTILAVLGEGGMGVVYRAEQEQPRRHVALKVLRPGSRSASTLRRFQLEVEMLGSLQHPGIAQVYAAGTFGADVPFFAMELARGEPITTWARQGTTVQQRLTTLAAVCDAVGHAHQRGILHRDLKPQNILVDAQGAPKVLDFGIARPLHSHDVANDPQRTTAGTLLGTLQYMSPEQLAGNCEQVDVRSDVYALGVVLYELLAGRLPHAGSYASWTEWLQQLQQESPPTLASLDRSLAGDLTVIAQRALSKERERRYRSPSELADELRRWLNGEPIAARADSPLYVLRRQLARRPGFVAAALLALVAAIAFVVWSGHTAAVEHQLREAAERDRSRSEVEQARLLIDHGQPATAELLLWRQHLQRPLDAGLRWALCELYLRMPSTSLRPTGIYNNHLATSRDGSRCVVGGKVPLRRPDGSPLPEHEIAASALLVDTATMQQQVVPLPAGTYARALAFRADGQQLAVGDLTGTIFVFEIGVRGIELLRRWPAHDKLIDWLAFEPSGLHLWSAAIDRGPRRWNVADGSELSRRPDPPIGMRGRYALHPDGLELAIADGDDSVRIEPLGPGEPRSVRSASHVVALAFAPDGDRLLVRNTASVLLLDADTLHLVGTWPTAHCVEADVHTDHPQSTFVIEGPRVEVRRCLDGALRFESANAGALVGAAIATPTGLITAHDCALRTWSPGTRPWRRFGKATHGAITCDPNGVTVAIGTSDRISTYRIADGSHLGDWSLPPAGPSAQDLLGSRTAGLAFLGPHRLAILCVDGRTFLLELAPGAAPQLVQPASGPATMCMRVSPTGATVLTGRGSDVSRLDAVTGKVMGPAIGLGANVTGVDFGEGSTLLLATGKELVLHDLATGKSLARHSFAVMTSGFASSPNGTLASLDLVGQLRLWPSFAAGPQVTVELPNAPLMHMQFCNAGRWLAIARRDGFVRLLDPVDGSCVLRVPVGQISGFFAHPSLPVIAWVDEDCPAVLDLRDLERPLAEHREFFAAKFRGEAMGR